MRSHQYSSVFLSVEVNESGYTTGVGSGLGLEEHTQQEETDTFISTHRLDIHISPDP